MSTDRFDLWKTVKKFFFQFPLFSADARIGVHCLQCATWRIRSLASAALALCVQMAYMSPSHRDNLPHFTCTAFSFSGHYHKVKSIVTTSINPVWLVFVAVFCLFFNPEMTLNANSLEQNQSTREINNLKKNLIRQCKTCTNLVKAPSSF